MKRAAALAACALMAACATAGETSLAPMSRGYLTGDEIARVAALIPDTVMIDGAGRPVERDTDRWWLAIAHAEIRPPEAAQHFDCALGTRLTARPRPALRRLMTRLLGDAEALTREASRLHGPHPRPIAVNPDLEPCQRISAEVRDSPSYPAAGAVAGTLYGETFAALAPDRADQTRRIGREIGASRMVCRMNGEQDVLAGERGAAELYPLISASPDFRADLEAARTELAAARAEGLTNPSCAAERRALGLRPGED